MYQYIQMSPCFCIPFLYQCLTKKKCREDRLQRLFSIMLLSLSNPAPPGDESIGTHKNCSATGDSIGIAERVPSIDQICPLAANLIDVQGEMKRFSHAVGGGLPALTVRADEQDKVRTKQV